MEAAHDYPDLFNLYGQREDELPEPDPGVDLVKTGPGPGWPTFEEIMDQVPDSPAKEAAKELREIIRRTPVRVCWEEGASVNPVLVCPPRWRNENPRRYKQAQDLLLFQGAWEVIENYMWNLLPTPEEVEGEIWGRP